MKHEESDFGDGFDVLMKKLAIYFIMRIKILLLISIFLFSISNISAKEKFTEKCDGFCRGENLKFSAHQYPSPSHIIVNGKRKKNPKWMIARAVRKPNSECIIFDSYIERAIPRKIKKKDFDKYMKDFREGTEIFGTSYNINSCGPCPVGIKPVKGNKTGYCSIPMIGLYIQYKTGYDKGYYSPEKINFSVIGIGRDGSFDILTDLPNASDNVVIEELIFPASLKKDLTITRFKEKASGNLFYVYSYHTYKTTAKNQLIKATEMLYLQDQDLIDFLNDYIDTMQETFSSVFDKSNKNFRNISKLYELIPNDNQLKKFEDSFKDIVIYHIQTRN